MKVAILGSGGGALAVAADMSRAGHQAVLADFDEFGANLRPVAEQGGVNVFSDWYGTTTEAVSVSDDVGSAIADAELITIVVPCFGHERWVEAITPLVQDGQTVLFLGEGSGSVVARRALMAAGKEGVTVAEANTLPFLARPVAPGAVSAFRKDGGVLIAALPSARTHQVMALVTEVWPFVTATDSVWNTILINYNAIDHVGAMVGNAGTLENRAGGMLLWGEGATPAIVNVIEAVDGELLALRVALGSREKRRYRDLLVAQGFAPDLSQDLYETVRASKLVPSYAPTGDAGGLNTRYLTEDVPYALVLASSVGAAVGVATPVVDGLIAVSSAMLARDFRAEGRTLETLGLGGLDAAGLAEFARTGVF